MELMALTLADKKAWAALLAECFERQSQDTEKLLDWLHGLFELKAWGIWEDNQLVAQYTALKRPLIYQNELLPVGMSVNMAVDPSYRGRGYIKKISTPVYEALSREGSCLGLGFSNAEGVEVDKHSKGYGYHVVGQMRPLLAPIYPINAPNLITTIHFPDDCLLPEPNLPKLGFPKDCDYLYKRYASHPFRQYHFAIWQEVSGTVGIVVYRPSKILGLASISILDIWGSELAELLQRFKATMWRAGFRLIQALVSPHSSFRELLDWNLLSPYARKPYYLTLKPLTRELAPEFDDFRQWDLIGGDIL